MARYRSRELVDAFRITLAWPQRGDRITLLLENQEQISANLSGDGRGPGPYAPLFKPAQGDWYIRPLDPYASSYFVRAGEFEKQFEEVREG